MSSNKSRGGGRFGRDSTNEPSYAHFAPRLQFLQVEDDRLVRAKQVLEDLVTRTTDQTGIRGGFEKRPEPLPDVVGKHAFQVLEGRAPKTLVGGVQAAVRNTERVGRQDQLQQREYMGKRSAGSLVHEFVKRRPIIAVLRETVNQPPAFPHSATDGDLTQDDGG